MDNVYFLRTKKDYADDIIKDLQKLGAVELITEDEIEIPAWQMEAVLEAAEQAEQNPSSLMDWETVKSSIKRRHSNAE